MLLVAVTGWGQENDRRNTREAGFDFHLVKPVDPEALQEVLSHCGAVRTPLEVPLELQRESRPELNRTDEVCVATTD
jgi:CheY-like chemotaxis protein